MKEIRRVCRESRRRNGTVGDEAERKANMEAQKERGNKREVGEEIKETEICGGNLRKKRFKTSRKEIRQRTSSAHFCGVFLSNEAVN